MDEEGLRRERQAFESWVITNYGPLILGTRDCELLYRGWLEGRATVLRPVEQFLEHLQTRGGFMPPIDITFNLTKE